MITKYRLDEFGKVTQCGYLQETLAQYAALPEDRRPEFLGEDDPRVIAYIEAQSQTANDATLRQIDMDVDRIYNDAIGSRTVEYQTAEDEALAYKAADYSGPVPPCVASWAQASTITAKQSADSILAQAAAWRGAVTAMRAQRLAAKAAVKAGTPNAMVAWAGFVAAIRGQLGLGS